MINLKIILRFLFICMVLFSNFGCKSQKDLNDSTIKDDDLKLVAISINYNPLKIALFQDKTGSVNWTRTSQLYPNDLLPLIELFYQTGGELGIGLINDKSNQSLLRLRIEVPPVKPDIPEENGNPFIVLQKRKENKKIEKEYQDNINKWKNETELNITQFMNDLQKLLDVKAEAEKTDILGAVKRGDLFLSESDIVWPQSTHRYLILNSDGINNVNKEPIQVESDASIILVNGSASVGSLTNLNPIRFESVRATIQYIKTQEGIK